MHASGKELYPRYSASPRATSIRSLVAAVNTAEGEAPPSQDVAAEGEVQGEDPRNPAATNIDKIPSLGKDLIHPHS